MALSEEDSKRAKFFGYLILAILVIMLFGYMKSKGKKGKAN